VEKIFGFRVIGNFLAGDWRFPAVRVPGLTVTFWPTMPVSKTRTQSPLYPNRTQRSNVSPSRSKGSAPAARERRTRSRGAAPGGGLRGSFQQCAPSQGPEKVSSCYCSSNCADDLERPRNCLGFRGYSSRSSAPPWRSGGAFRPSPLASQPSSPPPKPHAMSSACRTSTHRDSAKLHKTGPIRFRCASDT
jgi:hypothetical protein